MTNQPIYFQTMGRSGHRQSGLDEKKQEVRAKTSTNGKSTNQLTQLSKS